MPGTTSNMGLPFPLGSEKPYIAQAIQNLAVAVSLQAANATHSHTQGQIPAKVTAAAVADTLSAVYTGTVSGAVTGTFSGLANSAASIVTSLPNTHDSTATNAHPNLLRKDNSGTETMLGNLVVTGIPYKLDSSNKALVFENPSDSRAWNITGQRIKNLEYATNSVGSTSLTATRNAKIVSGVVTITFDGSGQSSYVDLTIPDSPFSALPIVVASISQANSPTGVNLMNVSVYSKGNNAFRVSAARIDGASPANNASFTVNWIAIGV